MTSHVQTETETRKTCHPPSPAAHAALIAAVRTVHGRLAGKVRIRVRSSTYQRPPRTPRTPCGVLCPPSRIALHIAHPSFYCVISGNNNTTLTALRAMS